MVKMVLLQMTRLGFSTLCHLFIKDNAHGVKKLEVISGKMDDEKITSHLSPEIKVGKINVDEQPELASKFGIMSIPTLVVMKNGKIVTKVSGARPKKAILEML